MTHLRSLIFGAVFALSLGACAPTTDTTSTSTPTPAASTSSFQIPVHYRTLDNGLRVVVSEDTSVPTATVAVYYNIGFRIEPRDRTGFAHLFEHLMFQGSENLGKMEFIKLVQGNGGVLNGSTRFDFTNYFQAVPAHKLETILWAEADRMRGLDITQENLENQQGVVKNEVKVNVLNRPYGGFPWLDMPQYANENWYNAHNFYGDLEDLDAATLSDVQSFFDTYYAPNNAALVVVGDVDVDKTFAMIEQYFSTIPAVTQPPAADISEPRQTEAKRFSKTDALAPKPAIALAWHMPERGTPEYFAMGVINEVLMQGSDSLLHQNIVNDKGYTDRVFGGINMLGNMYNYNGPMTLTAATIHNPDVTADQIIAAIEETLEQLRTTPLTDAQLKRAMVKLRSGFYNAVGGATRFGTADLLASFALFDDNPARINRLEREFDAVTPALIQRTVREYLRPTNRTVLTVLPGAAAAAQGD
ncbi:MAG: M16 family metallopeptidase [Gammaproteobacteria bacterium]